MTETSDPDPVHQIPVDRDSTEPGVADGPAERERESAATDETRYERELDAEESERHAAVERLRAEGDPEPDTADAE